MKYVASNGQRSLTKVFVILELLCHVLNLFETINGKQAIYGKNFRGQENNITTNPQDYFLDLGKIMRHVFRIEMSKVGGFIIW